MNGDDQQFAALAMYPLESLRPSWDRVYRTVAEAVPGAPTDLRWDLVPTDTWLDPRLALGMACGWPLVTQLAERVRVVGSFVHRLDGDASSTYRSVIVAREETSVAASANCTFAFNSAHSLSGYVSMTALLPPGQIEWAGRTIETGSHRASIDAVRDGRADIASIDALTWAYFDQETPRVLQGMVVIGRGPTVPHLPIITGAAIDDDTIAQWRNALAAATTDPALAADLDRLLIGGFVTLDAFDYSEALAPLA